MSNFPDGMNKIFEVELELIGKGVGGGRKTGK